MQSCKKNSSTARAFQRLRLSPGFRRYRLNSAGTRGYVKNLIPVWVLVVSMVAGNCSAWRLGASDAAARGRAALRSGDYARARASFESALKAQPGQQESRVGLLETLRQTGAYREAARRAGEFLAAGGDSAAIHLERGRDLAAVGDSKGAESDLRRAAGLSGSATPQAPATLSATRMDAVRELALLLEGLGRTQEAALLWDGLIDQYRGGHVQGGRQLGDIAVAAWHRGYIQDAKDIFIDATSGEKAGEVPLEALCAFGYLFLEKYDASGALAVFRDCLKINKAYADALLGVALAKKYENNAEVEINARAALEINPNLVPALNLLAELRMQEEDYNAAEQEIGRAFAINPTHLESLSLEAVYRLFRGDSSGFAEVERKVLAVNPSFGRLYYAVAENLVSRRKYQEAVDFDRRAVALDPQLWAAWASLGMNLTRVGDLAEGRRAIQRAFDGDSFNIWAYNSLELLDSMDKFGRTQSEHFIYRMSKEDQPVLAPYLPKLAEEVYGKLTQRYGFIPKGPIQVEVFPNHEDFAVRTLGLPGLGALGVCFGKVVAIDSPRARKIGAFNWGSTLWHEFAHVVTLQMTDHNIPRWYSEGLSVYEERRARPGWGDDLTAMIVRYYKAGKLLKVSELNAGMMRPKSPHQIGLSYWQASLVCELIEEKFGFEKIKQTLHLFAENKSAEEVFRRWAGTRRHWTQNTAGSWMPA
jgi:tetratricopeptide (TPR) repeat protein